MKTSHEMAQSVLKKQRKILRRRKAVFATVGAAAGIGAVALAVSFLPKRGIDLVESSTPISSVTLPAGENTPPLDLLGFIGFGQGKYFIATDIWQKSDDYELFRKYFFGTWETSDTAFSEKMVIDDTEQAYFCKGNPFRFDNFYIISENVLAFVIQGSGECELFWLDINSPETMYHEPFVEYRQMNSIPPESADNESFGGGWLYDIEDLPHKPAVYSKTAYPDYAPINVPEKDYLSIYKLREMSRDYGIDLDMLVKLEYCDKISGFNLLHDDWYHFYPVYLVSEEPDRLTLNTTLGNTKEDIEKAEVTYTIEKVDGVWKRTEEIGISDPDDVFGVNEDVISELGMTFRELADKYGCEPQGAYNQYSIENGHGRYGWKTSDGTVYEDTEPEGGCNMIDGIKLSDLFCGIDYPVSYDELQNKYGFKLIEAGSEAGMDDCYWSTFELPAYRNVSFIFYTREYGVFDEASGCCITLNNAEPQNDDLFSTEEGISFLTAAQNAARAFLCNDKEQLSEYLYDPDYDAGLSENGENLFDKLDFSEILPDESITSFEADLGYPVTYKFTLKGSCMLSYLDMWLIKTDSGWKVKDIYLQG